jgi:glutaredoxin
MYIIFGSDACTYCKQASALLDAKGLQYLYLDISKIHEGATTNRDLLFQMMKERDLPLPRSIPQIFKQDEKGVLYVGGFTELKKSLE